MLNRRDMHLPETKSQSLKTIFTPLQKVHPFPSKHVSPASVGFLLEFHKLNKVLRLDRSHTLSWLVNQKDLF